ncbi:Crp/Fnr family transcriptional regulator [Curvibacter sp. APW13]|uniref:Crp/Fnr family transcriptional regulator n=1 Tax=Curvibacter sp. APW13 TaxID=3077236 RepID=UPI0028E0552E|nr:Crp/Fnr family transcriptional regulator [Curvibacter sp. APW13]MDT8989609.1 Crp/Fnr family transcriptional regulator [Curvibacter sp. APW13]
MLAECFDAQRHLSNMPLFSGFSQAEREQVARGSQLRRFGRGDMVYWAGEHCDAFHFVISGQVKLYVASSNGMEKVVELVGPGQSFAEATMFLPEPHLLNAQALQESLILSVSKEAVFEEIQRNPGFSLRMLSGISHWFQRLLMDVESYSLQNGMQRLIGYLLRDVDLGAKANPGVVTVALPVSKATIASRLSLTPEYFSRVLHQLEADGLIEVCRREIRLLDVHRLARYGTH